MASQFQSAGATVDPSSSAPLYTDRFCTGLWTQRSTLRDAAVPALYEKNYNASRFDSLIGGHDTEVTTRLTLARRPGHSVYNSTALQYLRLGVFRARVNNIEQIHVVADCGAAGTAQPYGSVRDVTGPAGNLLLLAKLATSMTTYFQSVGNTLYMCDGAQAKKWVLSGLSWQPGVTVQPGAFLVDTNNNLQQTAGGGVTGGAQPVWPATLEATVQDGAVVWVCKGSAVMNWGVAGPLAAPNVTQTPITKSPNVWTANTFWNSAGVLFDPVTDTIQKLLNPGVTAPNVVNYSAIPGQEASDGSASWVCLQSANWKANQGHTIGDVVYIEESYYAPGGDIELLANFFQVIAPGVTGANGPTWQPGTGSIVQDGTVVWRNIGYRVSPSSIPGQNNRNIYNSALTQILDSKGGVQQVTTSGDGGAAAPNWNETLGGLTLDGNAVWTCVALPPNVTAPWSYAYALRNGVTGHISTASPISGQIVPGAGNLVILTGLGSPDQQVDTVRIYRTVQGGNTLLFLADIAAPAPGASWSYLDDANDSALNPFIQAQISLSNDPPPNTLTAPVFYLDRLWGFDGNVLRYSGGPDTLSGSGFEAWPPGNSFTLPSTGLRFWPTAIGLIAFTQSDVYIVLGSGTAASPFSCILFQEGVGLLNYDSFAVNGSTAYLMTTAMRCISFDPGAGETEVGFPIGDLLSSYTVQGTRMAYHEGSSADTALYVADGIDGWYRLSTVNAPESGQVWSPQALPVGGAATIGSIEVSPGVKKLLLAPYGAGPLLMRDATVHTDAGALFQPTAAIGSIVLAQPGEIAGVEFLTLDSTIAGTSATVGLRFGEIAGPFTLFGPDRQDPTLLPPSSSIRGERYYMGQVGDAVWCRHLQVELSWPAEDAANEILTYTIYGETKQEIVGS